MTHAYTLLALIDYLRYTAEVFVSRPQIPVSCTPTEGD